MRLGILSLFFLVAGFVANPQSPRAAEDFQEKRTFQVLVDGKPAGSHSMTIVSTGTRIEAEIKTAVKLDYLVYAYVYQFRAKETWINGDLVDIQLASEDDGKRFKLSLHRDAGQLTGLVNTKTIRTTPAQTSTAYWLNPDREERGMTSLSVLDVETGKSSVAEWKLVGRESLTLASYRFACQHYRIGGPSPADLWFDDAGRLVLQKGIEDSHSVELRLEQITLPGR